MNNPDDGPLCAHGRITGRNREVCGECAKANWNALADAWPLLHDYLEPRRTGQGGTRSAPASKPPMSIAASDLLKEVADWAGFYALALMDETNDYIAPMAVPERLRGIAERYGHFTSAKDRTALDFCDMAYQLKTQAAHMIERPPSHKWLGPCFTTDGCEGMLWQAPERVAATCDTCAADIDMGQWREHLQKSLETQLMKRPEIVKALKMLEIKCSTAAVHKWIQRGRLIPAVEMTDGEGKPLVMFRFAEALELAQKGNKGRVEV